MKPARLAIAAVAAALYLASSAHAALIITVGDHTLLPGTPNQAIPLYVSGGDPVYGLTLVAQVADGGPSAGGSITGPTLTADPKTGTIFDAFPGTLYSTAASGSPQIAIANALLDLPYTASATGLIATLYIDTTGFTSGTWDLALASTLGDVTSFAGLDSSLQITPGTITIRAIPEPAALGLLAVPVATLRRRRA
jgi:hypothetical protein